MNTTYAVRVVVLEVKEGWVDQVVAEWTIAVSPTIGEGITAGQRARLVAERDAVKRAQH